ncbi:hypothetical protein ACS0TY_013421 [Phlomoides rotata]
MVFPSDNMQDEFFYGLMWPKNITHALITFLHTEKQVGNWVWNSSNLSAILEARGYLNTTFHMDYTSIEVHGRVKKLRSRYALFDRMISQSGVVWNQDTNFVYASPHLWEAWREIYLMARAYMTQGEPLFDELKVLFPPDDGPQDDPDDEDDDDVIVIVDSSDDEMPIFQHEVMHALPALDQVDLQLPIAPDSPIAEVVMISSDKDSDDFLGYFDSDISLDWSDEENHIPVVMVEEAISEIVNPPPPNITVEDADEMNSPNSVVSIPAESLFAIREAMRSIPQFTLRDGFTTSDDDSN